MSLFPFVCRNKVQFGPTHFSSQIHYYGEYSRPFQDLFQYPQNNFRYPNIEKKNVNFHLSFQPQQSSSNYDCHFISRPIELIFGKLVSLISIFNQKPIELHLVAQKPIELHLVAYSSCFSFLNSIYIFVLFLLFFSSFVAILLCCWSLFRTCFLPTLENNIITLGDYSGGFGLAIFYSSHRWIFIINVVPWLLVLFLFYHICLVDLLAALFYSFLPYLFG